MKTSPWLTAFWMLVLALPLLALGIMREDHLALVRTTAQADARSQARDLLLEAQSLALAKDSIGWLLRQFQQEAEEIAMNAGDDDKTKRRRLKRLYRTTLKPWLPAHALKWHINPVIVSGRWLRIEVAYGLRFPENFTDLFLKYGWTGKSNGGVLNKLLGRMIQSPVPLEYQNGDKNGKMQAFAGKDGLTGFYWRVHRGSGIIAWLDLTSIDRHLGMRIAAAQAKKRGCGLLFTDGDGTPIVGGGEWRTGGRRLVDRLMKLGKGRFPAVAVVGRRLAVTGLLPAGMPGRIIVTVPWPTEQGSNLIPDTGIGLVGFILFFAFFLMSAASFIGRRATVGWMLLGACFGLAIVPAGTGLVLVRRAVAEYGRGELRSIVDTLHNDLVNLDNGGMALHAALYDRLLTLTHAPGTLAALEAQPTSEMRRALLGIFNEGRLPDTYPRRIGSGLMLGVAPDDKTGIISGETRNFEVMPDSDKPLLEIFGPFAKKIRDAITRVGKEKATGPAKSDASVIRESMKTDILYDLYQGIIGIDAMVNQFSFPEQPLEVKTSFIRVFVVGLQVLRERRFPTDWLLFWMWADSVELAHIDRIFKERFGGHEIADRVPNSSAGSNSPDAEPAASEIWLIGGMAELTFNDWIGPAVAVPPTLHRVVERARMTGVLQTGRDVTAPGRPVFEAFPGVNLPRFVIAGQVATNKIERRVYWLQLGGNALAFGLVITALMLAWYGRGRLLKPLERMRIAMMEVATGHFEVRIPVDRSDEFGTLAVAFNSMARALQEAAILGRFVSGSVRRAVRDRRADGSGCGEHREVTVLFSCLFRFEVFCREKNTSEIFDALGAHLGALNEALSAFSDGAEIDKVIGDKILVVFDHERFGGKKKAAAAVMAVVTGVKRRLHELGLEASMGINTGQVISGILGATSVRLDHTVIGDPVNLASRLAVLAHMTEGTRIVLSGAFLEAFDGTLKTEKLPFRRVKGKTQEVEAYLLIGEV